MASSSNTSYLILVGVIAISLVVVFAVLQPMLDEIQEDRAAVEAKEQTLSERETFLRTLDQKIAALTREAQHEQQLNVVLPVAEEGEDVVRLIHQAEIASGGTVRRVNNISAGIQNSLNNSRSRGESAALPEEVVPLGMELDFAGSYQQLRVFLSELQRAPRLLDITTLEIRRNVQVTDSLTATMTLQFYRYAEPRS